ncbi:cytochrome P450 [Aspergillus heteromorphus CBS 117.55]|uniref:Cytochrome P450 n=1 Tax=Aspergillus heteromorphus CBS 117.55 TaxID=1448321 RepID=A0A317V0L2_9EURO|nr:cytochrome P450 [Aspergillus heteromorphus CBS 117.55]PWY65710.1 cytochrome P450 [Aspergillus heteromorphus CBS 117.55]
MFVLLQVVVALVGLYLIKTFLTRKQFPAPLPPGPKAKPIIGNLWDLPSQTGRDWLHWYKYRDTYGPISSVNVFGETLIIVNDAQIAVELLEKRSANYSERPTGHFSQLAGFHQIVTTLQYSDPRLRAQRKLFQKQFGSNNSVAMYNSTQEAEAARFLLRVLDTPEDVQDHIRKQAGAMILKMTYGYNVAPRGKDPLVELVSRCMQQFAASLMPGAWIVDFIPFLKHTPTWIPGISFPRVAKAFREDNRNWSERPYAFVKQQMANGTHEPSFVSGLVEKEGFPEPGSDKDDLFKWTALAIYGAASDTTIATTYSVFIAMAVFPEVQRKAHEEIDRVIGTGRIPGYADRENLPYINAMVKEAFRWHTVIPMGVAHNAKEDDMFEGYFIPKGAQVLANLWAFTHDPTIYSDPMTFKPERFLESDTHTPERDPHFLSFGFGRRVCAGRTLADANVYLSIVQSLAALQISKPIKDGKEVDIQPDFLPGVISHVGRVDLDIKPRSKQHEELIRALGSKYPFEKDHAEEINRVKF